MTTDYLILNNFVIEVTIDKNVEGIIRKFYDYSYKEIKQTIAIIKQSDYTKDNFAWYINKNKLFSFTGKTIQDLEHITNVIEHLKRHGVGIKDAVIYLDTSKCAYDFSTLDISDFLKNVSKFSAKKIFKVENKVLKCRVPEKYISDFLIRNWFYIFHTVLHSDPPFEFENLISLIENKSVLKWIYYKVLLFSQKKEYLEEARKNIGTKVLFF